MKILWSLVVALGFTLVNMTAGFGVAGGFKDKPQAQALKLPEGDILFLVMPVGYKF